jgi:sulfate transport system permease protein
MRETKIASLGGALLVGVALLYAALLLLAPIIALLDGALRRGIEPVIAAITAPDALAALRLTLFLAISAATLNALLGLICAWVLVRHRFPGRGLFNALVDLPFVVSPVIVGYVMIVLFGRTGWLKDFPVQLAFSVEGMLLVTVFVSLPFVIREVQPTLAALGREQEEAAYTLGASPWLTFRRVVFPAIRGALIYGVVLALARGLGEFGAIAVIGGGVEGVTETATIYIYRLTHDRNPIGAYSMAALLGVIAVGILTLMNRLRPHTAPSKGS